MGGAGDCESELRSELPTSARSPGRGVRRLLGGISKLGLAVAVASLGGAASASAATAPVALWHMNELSGTVMSDSIAGHDGTLHSVQTGLPGASGTAYGFSGSSGSGGSNSYVSVPSASDFNPGSADVSLTVHLKATSVPATPDWDVIRKGYYTTPGGEYKMEYQPSGQASCGFKGSITYTELVAGPPLNDGQWHTVECVKSFSQVQLIVDGQTFSKTTTVGTIANSDPVVIGAYPGSEFFQGALDEVSIETGGSHTPPNTTIDSGPSGTTNDPTPSFGFSSSEPGSSFECRIDSSQVIDWQACSSPKSYGPLADGPHSFEVRATDSTGSTDATPASRSFTVDATAPETTIDSGPSGTTTDPTPSFGFSSSEPGSSFECKVDAGAYAPCSSPLTTGALADGSHSFSVRATDSAGNTDATPASRSFTVDATAPETTIDSGPSGTTTDPTPSFGFSSSEPGSSFECKVDAGAYAPCSSPLTTGALADGSHSFSVRATDSAGNTDATPASRSFTVDATAPETTIDSGPSGTTTDPTPSFGFSSSKPGSSFSCKVDSGPYAPCQSPYTTSHLTDGSHSFSVRAKDAVGNTDLTPASRSFKIDTTAPDLVISSRRVKMRGGAAKVKLTCPAKEISGPCEGTLKLKTATRVKVGSHRRKVTLGSADYSIPAGKVARVEVELSKQSRKLVNALGKVRAKATTAVSDAVGNEGKVDDSFVLVTAG